MENYVSGLLGVAVSVLLFIFSYRQTRGAKKERIKTAMSEIENRMPIEPRSGPLLALYAIPAKPL